MGAGLLALGTACLVWALNLTVQWRVLDIDGTKHQKQEKSEKQEKREKLGRDFEWLGKLFIPLGLLLLISSIWVVTLRGETQSLGIAVIILGYGIRRQGLILLGEPTEKAKRELRIGSIVAAIAAPVLIGLGLWQLS